MSQQPKEKRLQRKIKTLEAKLGYSQRKHLTLKHESDQQISTLHTIVSTLLTEEQLAARVPALNTSTYAGLPVKDILRACEPEVNL